MLENEKGSCAGGVAARAATALLTTCSTCWKLHAPDAPLAFNPICSGCPGTSRSAHGCGVAP